MTDDLLLLVGGALAGQLLFAVVRSISKGRLGEDMKNAGLAVLGVLLVPVVLIVLLIAYLMVAVWVVVMTLIACLTPEARVSVRIGREGEEDRWT